MEFHENFFKILKINNEIINSSKLLDKKTKNAFIYSSKQTEKILNDNKKLNSYQQKTLTNEFLIYWNETISLDCENFWNEIKKKGILLERKEPLQFLLKNQRFKFVEQAIQIKKYWNELKNLRSIKERYNKKEIDEIQNLSIQDKQKRKLLLEKCLLKNGIPKTKYLYFGECMAYFTQTELFKSEFSEEQVNKLHEIWKNHS